MRVPLVWLVLTGTIAWQGCHRRPSEPEASPHGSIRAVAFPAGDFEVKVEKNEAGLAVLTFGFPDRRAVIPEILSLTIGKVGSADVFCSLDATNVHGKVISGYWVVGTSPENYRAIGCQETSFSAGDYELQVFTQRSEQRWRMHIDRSGIARMLPWESSDE